MKHLRPFLLKFARLFTNTKALHATVRRIDPQLPLHQMQTMEHAISGSEAPRRFNTVLISSFAVVWRLGASGRVC
jgi:hypothetical protein